MGKVFEISQIPLSSRGYLAQGVVFHSWEWYLTFEGEILPETLICMSEIQLWEWYNSINSTDTRVDKWYLAEIF